MVIYFSIFKEFSTIISATLYFLLILSWKAFHFFLNYHHNIGKKRVDCISYKISNYMLHYSIRLFLAACICFKVVPILYSTRNGGREAANYCGNSDDKGWGQQGCNQKRTMCSVARARRQGGCGARSPKNYILRTWIN